MSFEDFVLEFQPQASWFYRLWQAEVLAAVRFDGVVRFERLEEDLFRLKPIAAAVGAGEVLEAVPWLNRMGRGRWRGLETSRLAEMAAASWRRDWQFF